MKTNAQNKENLPWLTLTYFSGGGYQDYDRSPTTDYGRGQDSFSGFGNNDGFQQSSRKDSDDWGSNWDDAGWSQPDQKKESKR